jgi:hypothetical protein
MPVTKAKSRPAPVSDTRRMKLQKAKPAATPEAEPQAPPNPAAKETLLLMSKGDIGSQEIVTTDEGSSIACYCGEELGLRGEWHREILKCRDCGMSFRVFAATHPKSGASMAVMIPRDTGK